MRAGSVLAIDQGTSSTKAVVVGADGTVGAVSEVPVRSRAVPGGGVEQDPAELWESVCTAARGAVAAGGGVDAVALANQGETVLAWDRRTGEPLSAAIVWQDRRAETVCDRLRASEDTVAQVTGLRLDSYFAAPKMTWLREQGVTGGVVTTTDAWLLHRLTGRFVTDAATASRTALLDLDACAWSPAMTALFGIGEADLPEIADCAGVLGTTTLLGTEIPVAGAAVDQQAALFAQGCHRPGEAKCTYGTGAFLLASTGKAAVRSGAGLVSSVAWRIGGEVSYCLDGQVYAVGSAVDWLARLGVIDGPAGLDSCAAGRPAGPETFVPALAGLAAPYWAPSARGALAGLGLDSDRAAVVRAVVEGIAASVAALASAVAADLGRPLTRLRADGGLTRSRALMQAQADLLQVPVEVYSTPHATALGVAALARLGLGWVTGPAEAASFPGAAPAVTVAPRCSADEAAGRRARWDAAVEAVLRGAGG